MILPPQSTRSVRVQWIGDPNLKEERAYRIIAEQLPVNLSKEKPKSSSVKILVSYHGALFVTPPGLSQNVTPDFFGVNSNPKSKFVITSVEKAGNDYKVTGDLTMIGQTKSVTFPAQISEDELVPPEKQLIARPVHEAPAEAVA